MQMGIQAEKKTGTCCCEQELRGRFGLRIEKADFSCCDTLDWSSSFVCKIKLGWYRLMVANENEKNNEFNRTCYRNATAGYRYMDGY